MTEIFTAKTVEEAKKLAVKKFGKDINEIDFEVIEEAKKGFLGMGAKNAKVRATFTETEPPQQPEHEPVAEIPEPVQESPAVPSADEIMPEELNIPESPVETEPEVQNVPESLQPSEPVAETAEKSHEDIGEYSIENLTLIEDKSLMHAKVKLAIDYITSILRAMDIEADFTVYQNETSSVINIESSSNGTIIGRRGETLDSIQYLCSIIANKGDKDYFRITIDCLDYRRKRKETLEQLAQKVAKSVLRTGRSQPLEPMNPYERRVIHSAVSAIEGVSSHSVGEEPYRKIIISSDNPKNNRNNGKKRYNNGGNRNDRRNSRPKKRTNDNNNFERKKVDISTSFEKDYKRPKPEDSIEGGLYGKIEL